MIMLEVDWHFIHQVFFEGAWATSSAQPHEYALLKSRTLSHGLHDFAHKRYPRSCHRFLQVHPQCFENPAAPSSRSLPFHARSASDMRYLHPSSSHAHACTYIQMRHLRLLPSTGEAYEQYWNQRPKIQVSSTSPSRDSVEASQDAEEGRPWTRHDGCKWYEGGRTCACLPIMPTSRDKPSGGLDRSGR